MTIKKLLYSRRTVISVYAITCLTGIGLYRGIDVSMAIATVAVGLAASNSYQKKGVNFPQGQGE